MRGNVQRSLWKLCKQNYTLPVRRLLIQRQKQGVLISEMSGPRVHLPLQLDLNEATHGPVTTVLLLRAARDFPSQLLQGAQAKHQQRLQGNLRGDHLELLRKPGTEAACSDLNLRFLVKGMQTLPTAFNWLHTLQELKLITLAGTLASHKPSQGRGFI